MFRHLLGGDTVPSLALRDISISYSNPFQVKIGQGSCDDICGSVGFVCEPAFFPMLNVEPVLAL